MVEEDVLILGAGPAGMAASFELHKAGRSFTAIEKNKQVGGLSRTFEYGRFRTDTGPHRFFSQNKYLYDLIGDLLGKRWIKVDRLTRFYIDGKFFIYPVEIKNALLNVGLYKAFRIITDYALEKAKGTFMKKEAVSFEDHIVSEFGRTLAELNMLNYTEKIWGLPCSQISPDWAKQRIKGLSIMEVLKKGIRKSNGGPKTLVDQFYYPDSGTGLIYDRIRERVSAKRRDAIRTESRPTKVKHDGKRITQVSVDVHGKRRSYEPKNVLSSIPITELLGLLEPKAPQDVLDAAKRLKFRSHLSLFITLNKDSVFPDQWIYFPGRETPFGRIMEPKNFSRKMSPPGKTSLLLEFFCWENDEIWNASKEDLFESSIGLLERMGFLRREDAIDSFVHRERYAYPIYDLGYSKHLEKVKGYLSRFGNLQLIGRAGSFKYNNQDHALEMGILAARNIIEGKRHNIEDIGSEQQYFERGYLK